jgi:uncharacterized protein
MLAHDPSEPTVRKAPGGDLGIGAGLRVRHYQAILDTAPKLGFFEVISENFMVPGGKALYYLDAIRERYPIVLHGVSLSIGGPDELDRDYLAKLKLLVDRVNPPWVTDHFCFGSANGVHVHDLLPLPYTDAMVARVARRLAQVQDFLERPVGLENTSSYLTYRESHMTEWDFIRAVVETANAWLLLDVNNIYVSAYNHGYSPLTFLENVPVERVLQVHMAGHTNYGKYIIDTHRGPVPDPVLELYREAIRRIGAVSTLLEWDDEIPELPVLVTEVGRLETIRAQGLHPGCAPLAEFKMPSYAEIQDSLAESPNKEKLGLSGDGADTLRFMEAAR